MSWSLLLPRKIAGAQREEGSSIVEFALTFLVVMGLIFGVMQLCLAFYSFQAVNEYARAGARYAMVHGSTCTLPSGASCQKTAAQLQTVVQNFGYPGITASKVLVTTSNTAAPGAAKCLTTGCLGSGDQIKVTVTYAYKLAIPFIPSKSFNMVSTSAMIISQ
jgi:Flp pilus assembly protein TadG